MDKRTHLNDTTLAPLLDQARFMWSTTLSGVGELTAYATTTGLVCFLDFDRLSGWTMLSECPSISIKENAAEFESMLSGLGQRQDRPSS